jgi:hypothetical protein
MMRRSTKGGRRQEILKALSPRKTPQVGGSFLIKKWKKRRVMQAVMYNFHLLMRKAVKTHMKVPNLLNQVTV